MGINLYMHELIDINNVLKLIIDDKETKVDALLKFKLLGLMKAAEPHVSNFETIRNEKILEYGEETENGSYQIAKENLDSIEKFNRDMECVLNSEVTFCVDYLKINDIFDKGIKAEYLIGLYPIIKE